MFIALETKTISKKMVQQRKNIFLEIFFFCQMLCIYLRIGLRLKVVSSLCLASEALLFFLNKVTMASLLPALLSCTDKPFM